MILTCPDCGTQYVVKDGAIPPEGRQVRCAACKHSWHQDPEMAAPLELKPEAAVAQQADAEAAGAAPDPVESFTEATMIDPRSGPETEERAYEGAVIEGDAEVPAAPPESRSAVEEPGPIGAHGEASPDWSEPPAAEAPSDDFSPFADEADVELRKRSPLTTILVVALVVVILAALFWFFAPQDLRGRLGLGMTGTSPLALVTTHMDRQRLESGNELLTVTGRVINPTGKEQDVPPLQAQLRSKTGKVVYSWTIAPPARSLAAGASASFNSAEVNVPPGGDELTITLGQPGA